MSDLDIVFNMFVYFLIVQHARLGRLPDLPACPTCPIAQFARLPSPTYQDRPIARFARLPDCPVCPTVRLTRIARLPGLPDLLDCCHCPTGWMHCGALGAPECRRSVGGVGLGGQKSCAYAQRFSYVARFRSIFTKINPSTPYLV